MRSHELEATKFRRPKRVGRGISAGQGKTAGRGTKGQGSRKSGGVKAGFEGGQNPLMRRIPKLPGFRSLQAKAVTIQTGHLIQIKGATVDNFTLFEAGLLTTPYSRAKLVVRGEVTKKYDVRLQGASKTAVALVQKAGGSYAQTYLPQRTSTKTDK